MIVAAARGLTQAGLSPLHVASRGANEDVGRVAANNAKFEMPHSRQESVISEATAIVIRR